MFQREINSEKQRYLEKEEVKSGKGIERDKIYIVRGREISREKRKLLLLKRNCLLMIFIIYVKKYKAHINLVPYIP